MKIFKEKFLNWLDKEIEKEYQASSPAITTSYRALILMDVKTKLIQIIQEEYGKMQEKK